ncbi:hypothetical protein LAZ67_15001971 [Cordylochernes scorpioides]|uniref:Mos1 transposase HTH domain-containing protein n=1 Tax=Cordylochernes scorpioides TaxID=51811 RepID=A0ABY6LCS0_9ARAC|nr:hypothetical protein LAZ67_15001971 [Cordylochernes scorpioides]
MEIQRICIKFCVKNEFKDAENFWMLKTAYGDAVMSRRRVFEWYKRFKEGREETADNERSGRPSTSTTPEKVDKVLELVHEDRRITVREVAEEAGKSFGRQSIMKDILGILTGNRKMSFHISNPSYNRSDETQNLRTFLDQTTSPALNQDWRP